MADQPQHYIQNADGSQGSVQINQGEIIQNFQARPRQLICPVPLNPPDKFGGRDAELAELKLKLKAEAVVAITALEGLGGIGKTTLALKLAHDLYHESGPARCFRAVLWLRLGETPDELDLLARLVRQVEPEFALLEQESRPQLEARVRASLREAIEGQCQTCQFNRVLVVLDDVWPTGVATARKLKSLTPAGATLLVTTRFGLVSDGLAALSQAVGRLSPEKGAELLAEYLPGSSQAARERLSQILGGHALALKLAALRLPRLGRAQALQSHIEEYRRRLADGTNFEDLNLPGAPGESGEAEGLARALSYSYELLKAGEQAHFRALGALPGEVAVNGPLLAGLWGVAAAAAESELNPLYTLGLLEDEPAAGEKWYRLHPLLHSYARALLRQNAEEYRAATAAYQNGVIRLADQFYKLPPEEWIKQGLEAYRPHLLEVGSGLMRETGLSYPADGQGEPAFTAAVTPEVAGRALAFARNTYKYLLSRQEVREEGWLWLGLAAARHLSDRERESLFLASLGNFYKQMGEKAGGLARYEQALALVRELGDQEGGEANTLSNIGAVYSDLGDQDKALDYLQQALPLRRAVGDRSGEAATLNNIGGVYDALGDKEQALSFYNQALPLQRAVGDRSGEAVTCFNIGMVYRDLGQWAEAVSYVARCVALDEQIQHPDLESDRATLARLRAILAEGGG